MGDIPVTLIGDPLRLAQAINNLLSNAVKFTNKGHIRIAARSVKIEQIAQIEFCVKDTGEQE